MQNEEEEERKPQQKTKNKPCKQQSSEQATARKSFITSRNGHMLDNYPPSSK